MSNTSSLTARQLEVYQLIRQLIVERGYGPTVREIGDHFQIKSPNGVVCHLKALERKGLIIRNANKSRSIQLTDSADRRPHSMPMAGMVAGGPTRLAFDQMERVDFSELLFHDDRFILRVSGDSMIKAHIADGDYVVVQKRDTADPGAMVVAVTPEGEATLKYWHPDKNGVRLEPANDSLDPIYLKEARILGVAVGVVRAGI
jgi:repressor LexA